MRKRWTRWGLVGQQVSDGAGAPVGQVVDTYPFDGGEVEMVVVRLGGAFGGKRMLAVEDLWIDGFSLRTPFAAWQIEDSPELSDGRHSAEDPYRARSHWRFEEPAGTPAQVDRIVGRVPLVALIDRVEVGRRLTVRCPRPRPRRVTVEEGTAVIRGEEPLVGIDDEAVGLLDPGERRPLARRRQRRQPVGAVDVQPQSPLPTDRRDIGQIVDDEFFQSGAGGNEPRRVLLPGPIEVDIKGVDIGYGAVAHARYSGAELELVRVSPWRPSGSEPLEQVAEFHTAIGTAQMARLLASCDVLVAPNRQEEGFGLPAAEAMASGVPVVATRIPSHLAFDANHDYAAFADQDDAEALGDALLQVIEDDSLRHRLIRRGREVAEQFRAPVTGARLERFLLERRR